MIDTADTPRTKTGLTLLEAEARIDSLEAAAAKAVLLLTEVLKHEKAVDGRAKSLLSCVDLLFDELRLEDMKHSEYVANSLQRTGHAVGELRKALREQGNTTKN